jgi:hypothetical protein
MNDLVRSTPDGRSAVANSSGLIDPQVQSTLLELSAYRRHDPGARFAVIAARRLAGTGSGNPWREFATGQPLMRPPLRDLPQKGTLLELMEGSERSVQTSFAELLSQLGLDSNQAANVFLGKLREVLLESRSPTGSGQRQYIVSRKPDPAGPSLAPATSESGSDPLGAELETKVSYSTGLEARGQVLPEEKGATFSPKELSKQDLMERVRRSTSLALEKGSAKEEVAALDRVIELLRTLTDAAREYAVEVVTLIQQYLDWLPQLRESALQRMRDEARVRALDDSLLRVDRKQLANDLGGVGIVLRVSSDADTTIGSAIAPVFHDVGLDQSFQRTVRALLEPRPEDGNPNQSN